MDRQKEATQEEEPGWLSLGAVILPDDVTPHITHMTRHWFEWFGFEVLQHPPQTCHLQTVVSCNECLWSGHKVLSTQSWIQTSYHGGERKEVILQCSLNRLLIVV
jgi:hypothetical protein